ncbi:hypothetical protein LCGC14_2018430, partial [marine sediment metagenome]
MSDETTKVVTEPALDEAGNEITTTPEPLTAEKIQQLITDGIELGRKGAKGQIQSAKDRA